MPITFRVAMLEGVPGELEGEGAVLPPRERAKYILQMLNALGAIDDMWLAAHPDTPRLYDSGVRYSHEKLQQESAKGNMDWLDIPTVLSGVPADCEDLGSWRAAELRKGADPSARAVLKWNIQPNGAALYHVIVRRGSIAHDLPPGGLSNPRFLRPLNDLPNQWIEDPSAVLGM